MSGSPLRTIKKAAILGSGVMGMAIASHLAGCGVDCLVLDIVPFDSMLSDKEKKLRDAGDKSIRNKLASDALQKALKLKPPAPAFFSPKDAARITLGNFDDDFAKIKDCDLIIEVVVERLDIKKKVLAQVDAHRSPHSIVATNTSGLSIHKMVEDCSEGLRSHFLGTHYFNPVRFLKLVEIIPHKETKPEVVAFMKRFCEDTLGKGVVMAKDTPNFIANRIGVHGMFLTLRKMVEMGYRIEEVDEICGEAIGQAKSAVFKTADLVGLDTLKHVALTVYDNCPEDNERDLFQVPDFLSQMIQKGWLGRKSDSGFYKRAGKQKLVLDWSSLEYVPEKEISYPSLAAAEEKRKPADKLKTVLGSDDRAGKFAWQVTAGSLLYAAKLTGEISDSVLDVDQAMRWGFNRKLGPFEAWDAIGLRSSVERMRSEGRTIPASIEGMLERGNETFYKESQGVRYEYDLAEHTYKPIAEDPHVFVVKKQPKDRKVASNDGATLWNMGDGVLLYEMHTKMNAIDIETIEMQEKAMDLLDAGRFDALVLANDSSNFSVGANLMLVFMAAQNNDFASVDQMAKRLQDANMRMKYSAAPVVSAPIGYVFGGGLEICLHTHRVVGAAESYMGLVEVGVGLIPAGGGTKELLLRCVEGIAMENQPSLLPFIRKAFENIATAKVGTSFKETLDLGYLRTTDVMVANAEYRITKAKSVALGLKALGLPGGSPRKDIPVIGLSGTAAFLIAVDEMVHSGWASEHDRLIASKLAYILGGGQRVEGQTISEQELLDMEREAFLSLLGEQKTQERIQYMLMNNKPLRN